MILTEKIRSRLSLTGGLAIVAVGIMLIPAWSQVRRGSQPTTDSPFSIGSDERAPQPNFNNQPGQPVARDRATYGSNSLGGGDSFNADSAAVPGHNARPRHVVESQTFTLARTTYRLPKPAARQLATFLQQHLAGPHLVKADDNASTITVIASPEAQQTIGNLIQLLQGAEGQERPENPLAGFQPTLDGYYMDAAAEGEYTDDIAAPAENATTR